MTSLLRIVPILLMAVACGVPTDDGPRAIPDDRVPFGLLDAEPVPTTTPSPPTGSASVTVFLVSGDRLSPATRSVQAPVTPDTVLQALLAGVGPDETARNLRTAIAPNTRGSVTEEIPGRLRVELSAAFLSAATSEQVLAVAQIVYTLTGLPGVDSVTFTVSGRAVEVPAGDGTLKSGPVQRADFASVAKL